MQLDALKKEDCNQIFTDKVSGVKAVKAELEKLLEYALAGNTIIIWKLDRLGRNTVKLIELVEEPAKRKINLKSLSEQVYTTTATSNLFFPFMCILAEHERNIIRERTKAGLSSARARGRIGGRPKGLSTHYQLIAPEIRTNLSDYIHLT